MNYRIDMNERPREWRGGKCIAGVCLVKLMIIAENTYIPDCYDSWPITNTDNY
jgi:hypothetical protein